MKTKIASQKHKLKWKKKILLFYILNYETRKHKEDAIKKKIIKQINMSLLREIRIKLVLQEFFLIYLCS